MFRVVNANPVYACYGPTRTAQGTCFVTQSGGCITDGPNNNYGNNERCTISVLQDTYLTVSGTFSIQGCGNNGCYDYFTINDSTTPLATASSLDGLFLPAGSTMRWRTNGNTVGAGWTLCGSVSNSFLFNRYP
jgi:hypothetical protein